MASGYLGKISAVVSANTADFQSKLNASAKDVSNFAKVVQSNLTSASRSAAKSLEGIYTPLQRFERAMQAAGSMTLSFKGFPGMIKDLDALQQRLNTTLTNRQVDVVLKTTGLSSVSAVRDAIAGLKSKDIEIITRIGGLDRLKEIQSKIALDINAGPATNEIARLQGAVEAANARLANLGKTPVTVAVNTENLDALNAKANAAREAVGKLMSGEFMGDKSLGKEISSVTSQVGQIEQALARATAARNTLKGMESGRKSSPQLLAAAEEKVSNLTGQQEDLQKKLAQLTAYRAEIKQLNREIKEASTGSGSVGGDEKDRTAAIRAVTKASRELQQQLSAKYGIDIDITSLNQLVDRADAAGGVIDKLGLLIQNLGKSDFEAAADSARKMQSASAQIFTPLEAAVKRLSGLAVEFQAPFQDALKDTQADAERLTLAIQEVGKEGPGPELAAFFAEVQAKAQGAVGAVDRLVEVTQKIGQLKTGREFAFEQPGLNEAINRGAAIGNQAAALPAEGLRGNPAIAQSMIDVRRLTEEAGVAYAKLLGLQAQKLPTSGAQAEVDALVAKIIEAQSVASREIKIVLDVDEAQRKADAITAKMDQVRQQNAFTITGRSQNMEQADSRLQGLRGDISGLDRSQRQNYGPLLQDAAVAQAMGDLDRLEDVLDQIAFKVAEDKLVNIHTKDAEDSLKALNKELQSIAGSLGEPVGMERLRKSAADADAAVKKLNDSIDKTRLTGEIGSIKVDLAAAEMLPAGATRDQAIEDISSRADGITRDAGAVAGNADTVEMARARIGSLNEAWAQSIRDLPETEAQVDSFFKGTLADIGKLNLADRISLDPMIREIMGLIETGAGISTVTARMLELEAATDELASAGKVSAAIEKLSPTAARNDLDQRLAAAKAAATSPVGLATPGETVEDIGRETELRGSLGKDLADSSRQTEALKGGITSLKSQIDSLPESVRSRFIPAIRAAENEFVALSTATSPLPGRIEAARQRVQQLAADANRATQAMNFGQSFGGAGAAGINLGLDQRALQGYNAQLQILQGAIGRASAEARGPAVAAFERLRNAVATAFDEGNIDSGVQRDRLAAIRTEAVAAAAAVSRIRVGSLTRDVARAGDVGRMGMDRWSMGLNQAAFAIDDFMSTSGGIEQKLRGISNNITQLGFVVGGTAGLFVGLGSVIAAQGAIMLIKYINNGRTAADQTKALNEALARQKSLVDDLAQSFKSLGDAMTRGTLSGGGQQAKELADQLKEVSRKQRESREAGVADVNVDVQRERAQQVALKRELEAEDEVGPRIVLARQIQRSELAEQGARDRLRVQPAPTGEQVARAIETAAAAQLVAGRSQRPSDERFPVAEAIRAAGAGLDTGETPDAVRSQIRALDNATRAAEEQSKKTFLGMFRTEEAANAIVDIQVFEDMSERLAAKLAKAVDLMAVTVIEASRGPAEQIRQAQEEVARAIELGLPGARVFQAELDKNATALQKAFTKLETAVAGKDADGRIVGTDERERLTAEAQAEIEALNGRRREMAQQADAFRYERTVDPQRQIDARAARVGGNLGAAGLEDGRIARRMREIENERETIRRQAAMPENDNAVMRGFFEGREAALNQETSAIEAATIAIKVFAAALDRASEEAKGNLNSAQQAADEARRADLGNSTPQTQEARARAEADLERQREVEREAQTEIAVERDRLEQMQRPDAERAKEIDEELKSGGELNPGRREALIRERADIQAKMEEDARTSQAKVEDLTNASTREEEARKSAGRGRELARKPSEKFAEETDQGLDDIQEYFKRQKNPDFVAMGEAQGRYLDERQKEARTATAEGRGGELALTERERFKRDMEEGTVKDLTARAKQLQGFGIDPADSLRQGIANQMESVAPMMKQLQMEREDMLLQGPSRKALQVSDVSTTQGASELTRLLRGDDSAKDLNLAELKKQSQKMEDLIEAVKAANPTVLL